MPVLRALWAVLRGTWLALDALRRALHLVLLLFLFGLLLAASRASLPLIPDRAALVLSPQGRVVEELSGDPLDRAIARAMGDDRTETRLRDLVDVVDRARDDDRIKALVLDLGGLRGAGLPMLQDLARSIRWFRESGKKVYAYGTAFTQRQYFLAAQADEVYLDPMGYVLLEGYGYFRTYFAGTLEKLGVDVNVFRAGSHKSAPDEWVRSDMSPEDREDARVWVTALWNAYKQDVAEARQVEPAAIQAYADEAATGVRAAGGDLARYALERGLVDGLKTRAEFAELVAAVAGEDDDAERGFRAVEWQGYLPFVRAERDPDEYERRVGVVVASGEILDGEHSPGLVGGESLSRKLREVADDDDIDAVVLRIDSPGGSILASEQIRRAVADLRESGKPVVASMSTVAASGGYYIAMDADRIVAAPTTITGSIGVFAVIPTFHRTLGKVGVTTDGFGTTVLSGQTDLDRPLGPQAREILQASVEHSYRSFVGHVARAREREVADVEKLAEGRVWTGADAREAGIVDELGGVDEAIAEAARLADLGEEYGVEWIEQEITWQDAVVLRFRRAVAHVVEAFTPRRAAVPGAGEAVARARALLALVSPGRPLYFCACRVE